MIRIYAPEIIAADIDSGTRVGSSVFVEELAPNSEYVMLMDGRCGRSADRVVKRLKGYAQKKILFLTHPHWDHYNGIEKALDACTGIHAFICQDPASLNRKYSGEVKENVEALERIIAKAKKKGIRVIYAHDGEFFKFGDIEFYTFRDQPTKAKDSETYVNQGSLCVWFREVRFLYTGDTGAYCAEEHNLNPAIATGFHHGNWLSGQHAQYLIRNGCKFYWDDDYSTTMTSFLSTGRGKAKAVGMKIFVLHSDLNIVAFGGKANIYRDGTAYSYKCPYKGKNTMKSATLTAVVNVLEGKYGGGDKRVTGLLDNGFNPGSVQGWVNKLYRLVKG